MACDSRRLVPAAAFTLARASAFISLVRNQSRGSSDAEPLISATLVSLSRKISLNQLGYLRSSMVCGLPTSVGIPARLADRLAAAHEAFEPRVVAQEVRVHVHDELVLQPIGTRLGEVDAFRLGRRGAVERAVDLVHGDEGRRHAGRGLEEAPARQAVLAAVLVGQRIHARLDLLLPLGLRRPA